MKKRVNSPTSVCGVLKKKKMSEVLPCLNFVTSDLQNAISLFKGVNQCAWAFLNFLTITIYGQASTRIVKTQTFN